MLLGLHLIVAPRYGFPGQYVENVDVLQCQIVSEICKFKCLAQTFHYILPRLKS